MITIAYMLAASVMQKSFRMEVPVVNQRPARIVTFFAGRPIGSEPLVHKVFHSSSNPSDLQDDLQEKLSANNSLLPSTVDAEADDAKHLIILTSTNKNDLEEVARVIASFDVKPRKIRFEVSINNPLDVRQDTVIGTTDNNSIFEFDSKCTHTKMSLNGRINDDGTITVFLDGKFENRGANVVFRVKNGENALLELDRLNNQTATIGTPPIGYRAGKGLKLDSSNLSVLLKATIVDDK